MRERIPVNFFVTCIGDVVRAKTMKKTVVLLEKLGCEVIFPTSQTCCGQPVLNSGYTKEAIPAVKNNIKAFEGNNYPIVGPAGSCINAIHNWPNLFEDDDPWKQRALDIARRTFELTEFLVDHLHVTDVGATLEGKAVYHPSCSLFRKLRIVEQPLTLLKNVKGLELLPINNQQTCCGFGGTFSVKMAELSGEMVTEKVDHILDAHPDYLIGADASCLMNIGGRLSRVGHKEVKVLHIVDVLVSDADLEAAGG